METNKRRLLKDLPVGNLKIGDVIVKGGRGHGGRYSITNLNTFYDTGGSSSNGLKVFDEAEESIIDLIWNNDEWVEDANLDTLVLVPSTNRITIHFKSIDAEDAEALAKGIIHILEHLGDGKHANGGYIWNKFSNVVAGMQSYFKEPSSA